jgi:uncharacterized protein (TIRG00374 family)
LTEAGGGRKRALLIAGKLAISIALLAYLLHRADLDAVARQLSNVGVGAYAGLVIGALAVSILVALRWQLVLEVLWRRVPLLPLWRYVIIGLCFNQALPSGVGGDAFRMWYLRRDGAPLRVAVSSVVSDRFLAFLAICLISTLALAYVARLAATTEVLLSLGAGVALLLTAAAAYLVLHRFVDSTRATYALRSLRSLSADGFRATCHRRGVVALALALTNQIAQGVILALIARATGLALDAASLILLFPLVLVATMIPVSFGGWGLREGAAVVIFGLVGIPESSALSISVIFGLVLGGAGLIGGVVWAVESRRLKFIADRKAPSGGPKLQ